MKKIVSFMIISLFLTGFIFAQTPSNENDSKFTQSVKINPLVTVVNAVNGIFETEVSYEYAFNDLFIISPLASIGYTSDIFRDNSNISAFSLGFGCGFKFNFFKNYLNGLYGEVTLGLENAFLTDGSEIATVYAFYLPLMIGYEGVLKNGFVWDVGAGFDVVNLTVKVRGNIGFAW